MPLWLSKSTFENATSVKMVSECFEDDGAFNEEALCDVISRAEADTLSWMVGEWGPAPFTPAVLAQFKCDPLLKSAATDYGVAYMFDRHPEYARVQADRDKRVKAADARMDRIQKAIQRPPKVATPPANVGGVAHDGAHRLYSDSPNGRPGGNAGDY